MPKHDRGQLELVDDAGEAIHHFLLAVAEPIRAVRVQKRMVVETEGEALYHQRKPAFFGDLAWPATGADLAPNGSPIPAQQRYEAGN